MSQRPTFTDRRPITVYERPDETPVCDRCGAEGEPTWLNVTSFNDSTNGIDRWRAGDWTCPNGPHPRGEL